jgi:serine phosphatase RsbU (regulator of sigma subunit)/streptogramin lyase
MRIVLVFLLCYFASANSFSQLVKDPYFYHIQPEKFGLQRCFGQCFDEKGTLWFCGDNGIYKYDGYNLKKWIAEKGNKNSPLSKSIGTFYRDREGIFWIAYLDQSGLTRFDPLKNKFRHFVHDSTNKESVPDALIVRFKEDDKGRFWLLMWDGGLVRMDKKTGKCKQYVCDFKNPADTLGIRGNRVKAMLPIGNDKYLLGFFAGGAPSTTPMIFDPVKETFTKLNIQDALNKIKNPDERFKTFEALRIVHEMFRDRNGNIWFGTYTSAVFYDVKNNTLKRVTAAKDESATRNFDNARAFIEDATGNIWVSTTSSGVLVIDPDTRGCCYIQQDENRESGLQDNRVGSFSKDADGNIWLSSGMGGFSVYVPVWQQFPIHAWNHMNLDFSNRSAQSIPVHHIDYSHNDTLLVSSQNGISYYKVSTGTWLRTYGPNVYNRALWDDRQTQYVGNFFERGNYIYMTTANRFTVIDRKTGRNVPVTNQKDIFGTVFIAGDDPAMPVLARDRFFNILHIYDDVTHTLDTFFVFKKNEEDIANIQRMDENTWVIRSRSNKLLTFHPKTKTYEVYSPKEKGKFYFPDSTIITHFIDKNKTVWVCCENGLYSFKPGANVKYINPLIGLDSSTLVETCQMDKAGILWIASGKSLIRYNPLTGQYRKMNDMLTFSLGTFEGKSGMDEKGQLFFATVKGLLVLNPEEIVIPSRSPKLYLESCKVGNRLLTGQEINELIKGRTTFGWNENFLNFEIFTDQLIGPRPHRIFYRLNGLDISWIDNGTSNQIRYTNLSHGNYTLEIKLINGYGIESKILHFAFGIGRPFWITWWFISLILLAFAALLYSFIKLRERALRRKQLVLEKIIENRTAEVVNKAKEIQHQKEIIEEKNKELTDSIHYAQRIQQSILPDEKAMLKHLPNHFVYFRPKDIVSGDFYWFSYQKDSIMWALVDCTGHGVPGGFMSMLGSGLLNQIVNEELQLEPAKVLDELRNRVIIALKQTGAVGENRDGMDISFCRYIPSKKTLQVAGANNSLYVISNNVLNEFKGDKQPIGIYVGEKKPFTQHEIKIGQGDCLYMSSDGYFDQFGGEKGKKFKSSSFEKLIQQINSLNSHSQLQNLDETFLKWKGDYEQVDDVCVIGVHI